MHKPNLKRFRCKVDLSSIDSEYRNLLEAEKNIKLTNRDEKVFLSLLIGSF